MIKKLAPLERTCRYGHGAMELQEGAFGLSGVTPLGSGLAGTPDQRIRRPDGSVFTVVVWRCATCGYIELIDEDIE